MADILDADSADIYRSYGDTGEAGSGSATWRRSQPAAAGSRPFARLDRADDWNSTDRGAAVGDLCIDDPRPEGASKVWSKLRRASCPDAFEGINTRLQRLHRFAQVVERTKGAR